MCKRRSPHFLLLLLLISCISQIHAEEPMLPAASDDDTAEPTTIEVQPVDADPVSADEDSLSEEELISDSEQSIGLPLQELRIFADVFERIKRDYVEIIDDKTLLDNAIRGMLAGLDPHSAYLDAEDYEELRVGTSGEFGGLGIEVSLQDDAIKVVAPLDDTPAQRAGIQSEDLIIRIDEQPVKGLTLNEAVKMMRGEPGTTIELTIVRQNVEQPLVFTLERAIIQVASVKGYFLEDGYAYLRIVNFQAHTAEDMEQQIATLREESAVGIKGLILDLRNNPGGVLNGAVGVSDAFLTDGLIVYTKGRDNETRLDFNAGPDDILDGAPLVVLINSGSASASEIVAGALQDQRRAILVGSATFGKGSVQTILPINDKTALKLTTARYYTPSGRSIQAQGIIPDILLQPGNLTLIEEPDITPLKESNLVRHLDEEHPLEQGLPLESESVIEQETPVTVTDYPLGEALQILKALVISRAHAAAS
jgi:carboxyl-terminal processing protease